MDHKLNPAATIIDMCGGIDALAAIVGCHRSTVYRWMQPRLLGGTGGTVPLRHALPLMKAKPGLRAEQFFTNIGKPQNGEDK